MNKLQGLSPQRVFHYFEEISAIPRGTGNMEAISSYCEAFAKEHSLRVIRDSANNVIIFKDASKGYEESAPVILQGHMDMVCQKKPDLEFDFETEGIALHVEGDRIFANGTTLGADNGIACAMMLAVLEDKTLVHPPIEAVFTTDEEEGMVGATALDATVLKGKRMINLDAEDTSTVTVSCAGGCRLAITVPVGRKSAFGTKMSLRVSGLRGGHSGMEIHNGGLNANILLGRILHDMQSMDRIELISVDGGDKANVIPQTATAEFLCTSGTVLLDKTESYFHEIKEALYTREPNLSIELVKMGKTEAQVMDMATRDRLLYFLLCAPNAVIDRDPEAEGMVETSLNLGVLNTEQNRVQMHFLLRSNKQFSLDSLAEKLSTFAAYIGCLVEAFDYYPPWERKGNSELAELYQSVYQEKFQKKAKIVSIHAGVECGLFADKIGGLDCIAIGPKTENVHTTKEWLSISSTEETYQLVCTLLERLK